MKNFLILILVLSLNPVSFSQRHPGQSSGLTFSQSYRLHPGPVKQTEVFIACSPKSEQTLFVSCNTLNFIPFFISEGVYVTTNGGTSWYGTDTCKGAPIDYHGGDVGITVDRNGTFILTRLGRSPFVGLYSHYSSDNGMTWSSQQVISTDDLERASLASDAIPESQHYGRSYAGWTTFGSPFPVMVAFTDDGGKHWSQPKRVNNPPNRCAGGDITVGPDGRVYVCWAGVTQVSPFKEIFAGFASSQDGGVNWSVTENAFPMSGISGILPSKDSIRVNSLPCIAVDTTRGPHRGWIYMVTCQKNLLPAGSDPDIILNRSADGGATWSAGIRVNQDAMNNGKIQYFPAVHVDRKGGVDILFYDDRNTSADSASVFLARSTDGGDSWTEYEISDHRYRPEPIGGLGVGYQGDNIDIASTTDKIWPVWMDNSTGNYQVWTVPVLYSQVSATGDNLPEDQTGHLSCAPNPCRDFTTLSFRVSRPSGVVLEIFDLLGKKAATIADGWYSPGNYQLVWNPGKGQTGIFAGKLTVNGKPEFVKIILQ